MLIFIKDIGSRFKKSFCLQISKIDFSVVGPLFHRCMNAI